ncbi:hypothetical protein [Rhodoferax sp.]|uniref:hypothetical protein n=1 Tax=Rhodoferax sp. TaxID=50421 RepID=UPI0025DB5D26|nr:hypothetical protein [Rhodoferax sp.]
MPLSIRPLRLCAPFAALYAGALAHAESPPTHPADLMATVVLAAAKPAASAAYASAAVVWVPPATWLLYFVPLVALFGAVVAILVIRSALLKAPQWSLADALSEETLLPAYTEVMVNGVTTRTLDKDPDGKPVLAPQMRASSSRVIALMGMVAILFLFIGFGAFALFALGSTGRMPDRMDSVVDFLMAGLTLFAPYLVNKFASVFQGLAGNKPTP